MAIFKGAGVAIITPFTEDNQVNYEELGKIIDNQIENGTDAIIICGTTGESATLSHDEHDACIRFAIQHTAGRVPVIAGTGSNSTAEAIRLSVHAEEAGADALLLVTPYYNKATQNGLISHYTEIAGKVSIPIIMYNVPSRTGVNIEPETAVYLAKHVKNIVGIKEASGNFSQIAKILSLCGDKLQIYSGNDDQITSALALGAKGVVSVLANVVPQETHDICQSYFEGDTERSDTLQLRYLELIENLFSDVNPVPVKCAMNAMGMNVGGCRLPLCAMDPVAEERLKSCLHRYGLIENAKVGSVTVRRPQETLLWRKNH